MFKVIDCFSKEVYTVYDTREEFCVHTRLSEFLIYKDNKWQ